MSKQHELVINTASRTCQDVLFSYLDKKSLNALYIQEILLTQAMEITTKWWMFLLAVTTFTCSKGLPILMSQTDGQKHHFVTTKKWKKNLKVFRIVPMLQSFHKAKCWDWQRVIHHSAIMPTALQDSLYQHKNENRI